MLLESDLAAIENFNTTDWKGSPNDLEQKAQTTLFSILKVSSYSLSHYKAVLETN